MEDTESGRQFSRKLWEILDLIGASKTIRNLHRQAGITLGILMTLLNELRQKQITNYTFGSFIEGTTTSGLQSDSDLLLCSDFIPVISDISMAPNHGLAYLIVRDDQTCPGYAKLQCVINKTLITMDNVDKSLLRNKQYLPDYLGRVCAKHVISFGERHGPASTQITETGESTDYVNALRVRHLLDTQRHGIRYIHRYKGQSGYTMDTDSCFLVGVGYPQGEYEIEWRLSFSVQEREMMFSFNDVQYKCYILLKMIKKDLIEYTIGKCITSYHCKTCMFFLTEITPESLWVPDNLANCVQLCLRTLLHWTNERRYPNYFIPEENMFDRNELRLKRRHLSDTLRTLISNGKEIFLRLRCDHIGDLLTNPERFIKDIFIAAIKHEYTLKLKTIGTLGCVRRDMLQTAQRRYGEGHCSSILGLISFLQEVSSRTRVSEYTETDTKVTKLFLMESLHLHLAQNIVCLALKTKNSYFAKRLIRFGDVFFDRAKDFDLTTVRLFKAGVMFKIQAYRKCQLLLEEIEADLGPHVISDCQCGGILIHTNNTCFIMKMLDENLTIKTMKKTAIISCVILLPSNIEIVPEPLQYEIFRSVYTPSWSRGLSTDYMYNRAAVDGKVFHYFLQYLTYTKLCKPDLQQVAMDNFQRVLEEDPNLGHKETAFNLLGWMFLQQSQTTEGVFFFLHSWRIRPYHNAAKWHMALLFHTIANEV